ncbi:MAG TPA: hypothetical protein VGM19_13015 [Armatimonadota bacterium]|jgi:hypothetical protein
MNAVTGRARRQWVGEVAVGLYAGVGAVMLRGYVFWCLTIAVAHQLTSSEGSGLVRFLTNGFPMLHLATLLPITALLAWLWMAGARRAELPTRIAAGIMLAVAGVASARHVVRATPEPLAWIARPDVQLLGATLLAVGLILWLPTPRRWRSALRSRTALVLLMLVPLAPVVLYTQMSVNIKANLSASEQRVRQVQVPVPPDALDVRDKLSGGARWITFTVRETYPSTTVADFYARHFTSLGWHTRSPLGWRREQWYSTRPTGPQPLRYAAIWTSPDGQWSCMVFLTYEAPPGGEAGLPVEQWPKELLQRQHVEIMLTPEQSPI